MDRASRPRVLVLAVLLALPGLAAAQEPAPAAKTLPVPVPAPAAVATPAGDSGKFGTEQLEQMLAPIALYPDDLLSQVLMASTYPLEIVQADRWAKAHKDLKGDPAAVALEKEDWDASVKSLINTPDVLAMLSDKLDWTQQLGDAFVAQQQEVMAAIQALRKKAQDAGQLESGKEQTVSAEGTTIVIESADPEIIYVPVYDTTIVYGGWPYPAYPPYPYYPPGYHYGRWAAFTIGVAWGYAWGHCNWHGGDIEIDIDRNVERNRNIDRDAAKKRATELGGKGSWKHDGRHRGGMPYRDSSTAKRYGGVSKMDATKARDTYRGRPEVAGSGGLGSGGSGAGGLDRGPSGSGAKPGGASGSRPPTAKPEPRPGTRGGAFDGVDRQPQQVKRESARGQSSQSHRASGGSRGGGGGRSSGGRGGRR